MSETLESWAKSQRIAIVKWIDGDSDGRDRGTLLVPRDHLLARMEAPGNFHGAPDVLTIESVADVGDSDGRVHVNVSRVRR